MENCIFCKISKKEAPADILYEDSSVIVFKDITPKAPIHLLIVPKKHIVSINHIEVEDKEIVGNLFIVAKKIAKENGIDKKGYRLIFNVGRDAGQMVDHLHLHLLAGRKLPFP
jgi:histidine triad (HIT) family protein